MKSWDIAKLLIQSCSSPEEVGEIIAALQEPKEVERVCSLLGSFAPVGPSTPPPQVGNRGGNVVAKNEASSKRVKDATKNISPSTANTSEEAIADRLEPLFRKSGMTNKQVERWITGNFAVAATVGKRSLREYLVKVLDRADLGLKNRIIAAAQQLASDQDDQDSDLVKYWDGFDKHFGASE